MGFVEWYTLVLFCIHTLSMVYCTGAGLVIEHPDEKSMFSRWVTRWTIMLPLVGRVFGWW